MPNSSQIRYSGPQALDEVELARKPLLALHQFFNHSAHALRLKMGMFDSDSRNLHLHIFVDPSSKRDATMELVIEYVMRIDSTPNETITIVPFDDMEDVDLLISRLRRALATGIYYVRCHLEEETALFLVRPNFVEGSVRMSSHSKLLLGDEDPGVSRSQFSLAEKV
ncbi:uncharacterized protein PV07_04196 [Cladophialophora immunda]|uniref:Uncharacterized protein n=1 Tax=Cladophialophora immunda TaxID=569365 RepID=A0A0D2B519_9EURO|nr:uncharacterized protein PV07_04196 [Cladophialophora immunda]KIW32667.1 hypothetical protein PV07_04196 [Cladophialophora immunda]